MSKSQRVEFLCAFLVATSTFTGCTRSMVLPEASAQSRPTQERSHPSRRGDVHRVQLDATFDVTPVRGSDAGSDASVPSETCRPPNNSNGIPVPGPWAYFKLIGRVSRQEIPLAPTAPGSPRFVRIVNQDGVPVDASPAGHCYALRPPTAAQGRVDLVINILGWERVLTENSAPIDWTQHQTTSQPRIIRTEASIAASMINTTPGTPFYGQIRSFDTLSPREQSVFATHVHSQLRQQADPAQRIAMLSQLQERSDITAQRAAQLTFNRSFSRASWAELNTVLTNTTRWNQLIRIRPPGISPPLPPGVRDSTGVANVPSLDQFLRNDERTRGTEFQ